MRGSLRMLGVFLVCSLTIGSLRAQVEIEDGRVSPPEPFAPRLWTGIRGAVQWSKFVFVPSVPQTQMQGYNWGLISRVDVERGASLQIELNYKQAGWRERFDDPKLGYERLIRSIELPLFTHLYLKSGAMRFYINAGPYVSWIIGDESLSRSKQGTEHTPRAQQRHALPIQNRFIWGLGGGPGISLELGGKHRLEIEGRFLHSLSDIWSNKRVDPYGTSTQMHFGLGVQYLIGW